MSLAGCQIDPKKFEFFFDKNLAQKIWSKKDKGMESTLPHAIRIKSPIEGGRGKEGTFIFPTNL